MNECNHLVCFYMNCEESSDSYALQIEGKVSSKCISYMVFHHSFPGE